MLQTIYLIRHTETVKSGHLIGAADVPLCAESQVRLLGQFAKCDNIRHIISSPRQRCCHAAKYFSETRQIPFTTEAKIQEMDFGDWDGQSYDWLWNNTANPSIGDFWQDPWTHTPPNGESMVHFESRVASWWGDLLASPSDEDILVVTHGGVIRKLLGLVLALPDKSVSHMNGFDVNYGAIVRLSVFYDDEGRAWPKVVF